MQLHKRRRPDCEEARIYEYPSHLRDAIADIPAVPGVYIFHGQEGDLPLYIGKSINLRGRLLAHLRNPGEARLLHQCSGVCRGDEEPEIHRQRLFTSLAGLRVACWPYRGAVQRARRLPT